MFYFTGKYLKVTERPQTSFDLFFNCICSYRPLPPHLGKHIHGDVREHYVNKVVYFYQHFYKNWTDSIKIIKSIIV